MSALLKGGATWTWNDSIPRVAAEASKRDLFGAICRIRILEQEKNVLESRLAEAEKYSERLATLAEKFGLSDAANEDDAPSEPQKPAA